MQEFSEIPINQLESNENLKRRSAIYLLTKEETIPFIDATINTSREFLLVTRKQ